MGFGRSSPYLRRQSRGRCAFLGAHAGTSTRALAVAIAIANAAAPGCAPESAGVGTDDAPETRPDASAPGPHEGAPPVWALTWSAPEGSALEVAPCPRSHAAALAIEQARAPWAEAPFDAPNLAGQREVVDALRADPLGARCLPAWAPLDDVPSAWLEVAARLAGDPPPVPVAPRREMTLDGALAALASEGDLEVRARAGSPALERALAGLVWAALDAVLVRDAAQESVRGGDWWSEHGGAGLLYDAKGQGYNAAYASDRGFLDQDRGRTYAAAIRLAKLIESTSWPAEAARGVILDVATPRGRILVRGTGDDRWADGQPLLVSVDLGGDDTYLDPVGANAGDRYPVSVHIDVSGDDLYTYPEAEDAADEARLPPDEAGRFDLAPRGFGVSASTVGRQGSGRAGIGLLYDWSGDDRYRSLRMSQGYAHHGVGVLYDAWGDDDYRVEDGGQGAGQYGVGLLIDDDGNDVRRALSRAQGHGFVGGVGITVDRQGDDVYVCDAEAPLVHPSEQLTDRNVSLCQGAGFGWRHDDPDLSMPGGVGWLLDRAGADRYEAGVFAQGVGYWQGLGLLDDRAGNDVYAAVYYARGSGLHFGVGVMLEGGGLDRLGPRVTAPLSDGSGHDFGLGVFWDFAGDDHLTAGAWSGGAGSCGGFGLRIDDAGADTYAAPTAALGAATTRACPDRAAAGVYWDGGGIDAYEGPDGQRRNAGQWGYVEGDRAWALGHDEADATPF